MAFRSRSIRAFCGILGSAWIAALAAEPQDPSFERFRAILLQDRPSSIAEALEAMRRRFPSYFAHHTLAYHSVSLHESNFENPRAIVFGDTAEFIITFNGDPSQRGYGSIEVMEFSPTRGYAFRAIAFLREPQNAADLIDPDEIELQTGRLLISKPNPAMCTSCHGKSNPRPIWEPFALWPGVYGSADDRLFRFLFDSEGRPTRSGMASVPDLAGPDTEKDGFARYLANRPRHARYKLLPLPQGLDIQGFDNGPTVAAKHRPNLALTKLFSIQAAKLIARDASVEPNGRGKLLLLAATECLRSQPTETPPAALKTVVAGAEVWRQTFRRDIAGMLTRDMNRMEEDFGGSLPQKSETEFVADQASRQPYLLASALEQIGLNIQDYSINVNRVNSYQDGGNGFFALGWILRETLQGRLQLDHVPSCADVYGALGSEP